MPATDRKQQPVITLKCGLTFGTLVIYLEELAHELAEWLVKNQHLPPEVMRSSREFYKVALVSELICAGPQVPVWDLNDRLAKQNEGRSDGRNFNQACVEVVEFLEKNDKL